MWQRGWREQAWSALDHEWDVVIIGGGITGAGILREATRSGLRAALLEAGDFASGTSSRSSKLVHGGFRYLRNGQIRLVLHAVRERQRLLHEGRGLVNPLGFLLVNYRGDGIPPTVFRIGLSVYDLLAFQWGHRHYDAYDIHEFCPYLREENLLGGFRYFDAMTDDARLVMRLIQEAVLDGALALNYARVTQLLKDHKGNVHGVVAEDQSGETKRSLEIKAQVTINASGAWADDLRMQLNKPSRIRKLRGSHLLFSASRIPLRRAVSFLHPFDRRPVFAYPWEGMVILGTTDVDHRAGMETDPAISQEEAEYLLEAGQFIFPELALTEEDVISTFSGIRPVIDTGKANPSKESREHILWYENGLLTVTGGKLTTFRLMALDALKRLQRRFPKLQHLDPNQRVLSPVALESLSSSNLPPSTRMRLAGRYGPLTKDILASETDLEPIEGTPYIWAELRWAAGHEAIEHLDDLLLRRVRLGLLLPEGGLKLLPKIQALAGEGLGWSPSRWQEEIGRYRDLWKRSYSLKR